jgi:hypothetical protein
MNAQLFWQLLAKEMRKTTTGVPGKQLHSYGKSPFLMGKSSISMAMFNSFLYVY